MKYTFTPDKGTPEYEEFLQQKREEKLRGMGIKKKFFDASFTNLINDDAFFKKRKFTQIQMKRYRAVKKSIEGIAENFEEHLEKGSCFIFFGPTGTGKDYFATCLAKSVVSNEALKQKMWEKKQSTPHALIAKLDEIMMDIKDNFGKSEKSTLQKYTTPELLVINEVGIQNDTDFTWTKFQMIVDDRYAECLPTIFITNLPIEDFKELVGDRVVSRCKEGLSDVIPFDWPDLRLGI